MPLLSRWPVTRRQQAAAVKLALFDLASRQLVRAFGPSRHPSRLFTPRRHSGLNHNEWLARAMGCEDGRAPRGHSPAVQTAPRGPHLSFPDGSLVAAATGAEMVLLRRSGRAAACGAARAWRPDSRGCLFPGMAGGWPPSARIGWCGFGTSRTLNSTPRCAAIKPTFAGCFFQRRATARHCWL